MQTVDKAVYIKPGEMQFEGQAETVDIALAANELLAYANMTFPGIKQHAFWSEIPPIFREW